MRRATDSVWSIASVLVLLVVSPVLAGAAASLAVAAPAKRPPSALLARTLNGADMAKLHLVRQHEEVLYEEGAASGALPGHMSALLDVGASTLSGRCTIYTTGGTITGEGHATPKGVGRYQSFQGTLVITGGTGRYKGIHGRAGLYGTFDRRTYALVVQTTGTLSY
jgi:hypothetical protein